MSRLHRDARLEKPQGAPWSVGRESIFAGLQTLARSSLAPKVSPLKRDEQEALHSLQSQRGVSLGAVCLFQALPGKLTSVTDPVQAHVHMRWEQPPPSLKHRAQPASLPP